MKKKSNDSNSRSEESSVDVIIETPRGSRNKFKFEPNEKMFKLSKILPQGMTFPFDFGFVPSTKADDGDPMDVLVLIEEPTFPGCVLECALIGVIEADQRAPNGETNRNDRLIATAKQSLLYSEISDIQKLPPAVLKQIEAFFVNYQKLRDVEVTILAHHGPERAHQVLESSRRKTKKRAA